VQAEEREETRETSSTEVGFIFQFPAMKGTRAISRESEAERAVAREAVARSAAPLPGMPGSDIGGTEKAAADATPVTATRNTPLYIFCDPLARFVS
jgi:hypothetical protein